MMVANLPLDEERLPPVVKNSNLSNEDNDGNGSLSEHQNIFQCKW